MASTFVTWQQMWPEIFQAVVSHWPKDKESGSFKILDAKMEIVEEERADDHPL